MSAGWREPSGSVPKELHNRPKYLVQHIREATVRSSDVTPNMITMITEREFLVQSSSRQSLFYNVNLGDESSHTMPSCDCRDFKKTHFPCKHFCALICHISNITWNSLPKFYLNNPHFVIDEDCVNLPKYQHFNIQEVEHSTTACAPSEDLDNTVTEPQQPQCPSLTDSARKVREILKELLNMTYIADSVEIMEEVRHHLSSTAERLREGCPASGTLLLENIPKKTPPKKRKLSTETLLKKLPTRAKRKRTKKHQFQRVSVNDVTDATSSSCKKSNKRKRTKILSEKITVIEDRQEMEMRNDKSNNSESPKSSRSEVLKRIKDMIREMSEETWMALLQTARRTASYSYDLQTRKAQAVLDECCDEDDHHDFIKEISELAPETFNIHERLRLSFLLLCLLVEQGQFNLKRDLQKEREEEEANFRELIKSLKDMRRLDSDPEQSPSDVTLPEPLLSVSQRLKSTSKPNNENLHTAERKDATQSSATKKRSDFDKKKSSINSIKLKRRKIERHVTWHDKLPSSSNTHLADSDIDQQKAQNHVDRIWEQAEESNYILAKVYGFNITDVDIKSLKRGKWLTDQVMDSYLACLAQKELDKGVKVKHEVVSTMTNIINDTHVVNTGKKSRVMEYDFIVGAYHQRGGHWDLVIVEPKRGAVFFYNPLGETSCQLRRAINSWRNYVDKTLVYKTSWHLETKDHAQQQDSCNCGVYCLMFAERHLTGETLLSISRTDVESKRMEIARTFLLYEVYMEKQCPCCGFETTNEDQNNILQCQTCDRVFHKKNHCVGEQMASAVGVPFRCKVCSLV